MPPLPSASRADSEPVLAPAIDNGSTLAPSVHAALLAVQVAFASLSIVGRLILRELDASALALLRLSGAALVFGVLLWRRGLPRIPPRDLLGIAGCAALGIAGNQLLFLHGLRFTTAVNATVLVATIPVFTVLASVLLRHEPARPRALAGVAIAFAGIVYLVGVEALELGGESALGDALVVANSFVYALYLVLVRRYVERYGSLAVVAWGFLCGALYALPFGGPALLSSAGSISGATWALVGYAIAVPTVFTYLTNAWALARAPSSVVAIYIYVQPVVAAVLALVFLGPSEAPTTRLVPTAIAVAVGIALVTRRPARDV